MGNSIKLQNDQARIDGNNIGLGLWIKRHTYSGMFKVQVVVANRAFQTGDVVFGHPKEELHFAWKYSSELVLGPFLGSDTAKDGLDSNLKRDSCFDGREFLGHGLGRCVPSQGLAGTVVH
ncbi:MAG: hypothetical protein V7730_21195 [Sulfitobacter sp.]